MSAPIRRRTRARELALQFLYTLEMRGLEADDDLGPFLDHHTRRNPDKKGALEVNEYARGIVIGVQNGQHTLDQWIERIASNWRLDRMAFIDRNVLRIAVYELLHEDQVPFKVVINEAIDLAKRFSTAQSGGFVNGILDRVRVLIQEQRDRGVTDLQPPAPNVDHEFMDDSVIEARASVPTPRPTYGKAAQEFKKSSPSIIKPKVENAPLQHNEEYAQPDMMDDLYGDIEMPAFEKNTSLEESSTDVPIGDEAPPMEPDDVYGGDAPPPMEPDDVYGEDE